MTELIWPPSLRVSSAEWSLIGNAGESRSPLNGVGQTIDRSGDRWKVTLNVENASDRATVAERSIAEAFLASIRNKNNRVWVTPPGYSPRGSFPATELFANSDFSNGVTGWFEQQSVLSVRDRVMRITVARSSGASPAFSQSPTVTAYRPLVARGHLGQRNRAGLTLGIYANGAGDYAADRQGLQAVSWVPLSSSAGATYPAVYDGAGNVSMTGDWLDVPFVSLAHCALVDNGPNAFTRSDEIDHADWTKANVTVTANFFNSPGFAATADRLVETAVNSTHTVQQTTTKAAVAQDWCYGGWFCAGTLADARNRILLRVGDVNGSDYAQGYFDLSTGVANTPSAAGTATNPRSYIRPMGSGWYYCAILCTTSTGTTVGGRVYMVESGTTTSYAGLTTADIGVARLALAQSSVPMRLAQTTSAATTGALQTGSGLYLKGLPASTQNLARAGDWCQIGDQLFKVTSPLDGDAAGLGYLTVSPNVRTPFADNAPVIFNQPMAKMRLATEEMSWSLHPGGFGTFQLTFEESL